MKLFVAYLFLCFVTALLLNGQKTAVRILTVLGLGLIVLIGYYFFHQI